MSLFFSEKRHSDTYPPMIPPRLGGQSFANPVVDEQTAGNVVAYGAAANLLASVVAELPVQMLTDGTPAKPLPVLQDPDGSGHGLADWLFQVVISTAYHGNAVGRVLARDAKGNPSVVELLDLRDLSVERDRKTGRLVWRLGHQLMDASEVWHYRRYPRPGRVLGLSPIAQFGQTIGLALSAERFGRQWFAEGAHPSSVLQSDQPIDQTTAQTIKARVQAAMQGTRETLVLGSGLKWSPMQVNPAESQFLETQGFTAAQCARILGPGLPEILGYPTGDSRTYKNREQAALDFLAYTVDPWLVGLEWGLSKMLGPRTQVRFDRTALLRADLLTRFQAHRIALGPVEPFETANEVRQVEGLQPVDWGQARPAVQGDTNEGNNTP